MRTKKVKVWAHRGASADYVENSLPAFAAAIALGVDGVELDVQLSLDGQAVVAHDENLQRLAGKDVMINSQSWSQLKKINIAANRGGRERMPLLKEVLELLNPTNILVNIELKNALLTYPDLEQTVVDLVSEQAMTDRVIYSTFNTESVVRLSRLVDPGRCALLYAYLLTRPVWLSRILGIRILHPHYKVLKIPGYSAFCQRHGIKIHTWTVNKEQDILRMLRIKPNAIITDHPELVFKLMRERP